MNTSVFEAFPEKIALEEAGFSSRALLDMFEAVIQEELELNSLLLLKGGRLAFEHHVYPYRADTPRMSFSMVEGFITTAVGLIVDQGLLDIDEKLVDIFPEHRRTDAGGYLEEMSVKHLLTSSTGHDTAALSAGNPLWLMDSRANVVQHFMHLEVPFKPGETMRYEPTHLVLASIVARRSGYSVQQLLETRLFRRVGIERVAWYEVGPDRLPILVSATPLDYARFGLLLQNHGRWGEKQLVSENWVETATSSQIDFPEATRLSGFGYFFGRPNFGGFESSGDHGQRIYVIPEKDLVVIMTGTEPRDGRLFDVLMEMLQASGIEDQPGDAAKLGDLLAEMNHPTRVPPYLPPCARLISGVSYRFAPEQYFAPTQLALRFEDDDTFAVDLANARGDRSMLVGSLDGRFRVEKLPSDNVLGLGWRNPGTEVAVRGRWTSDRTFGFEVRPLSYGTCLRCRLTIGDSDVRLYCKHNRREESLVALSASGARSGVGMLLQ